MQGKMEVLLRIAVLTVLVKSPLQCSAVTASEVHLSIQPSHSVVPQVTNSLQLLVFTSETTSTSSITPQPSLLLPSETPLPSPLLPSESVPLVTVITPTPSFTRPFFPPVSIPPSPSLPLSLASIPSAATPSLAPIPSAATSLVLNMQPSVATTLLTATSTATTPLSTTSNFTSQQPSTTSNSFTTQSSNSGDNDSSDQSIPVAAIIGIVIGGVITVTALTLTVALLVCFCCCCFKSKKYEYSTGNDRRMTVQQWNITSAHFNINRVDSLSSFGSSRSRGSSLFGSFGFIRRYSNSADHISSTSIGNQSVPDLYSTPL